MATGPTILTFDIGGTTTRSGIYRGGAIRQTGERPTPQAKGAHGDDPLSVVRVLQELTTETDSDFDAVAVSVTGMLRIEPAQAARSYGPFQHSELILSSPNIAGLKNVSFLKMLESVSWERPIHVENDANAALRAATEVPTALGINMGTGIAASVKRENRIQHFGDFWSCQEIGHGFRWSFPDELTRKCACGATGCLEAVVGSRALRERYGVRPENASPEIYAQMRDDVIRYVAPAVVDTAKRFSQRTVLFSGQSVIGFNGDGKFLGDLREMMIERDASTNEIELQILEQPQTSAMLGTALALFDNRVLEP